MSSAREQEQVQAGDGGAEQPARVARGPAATDATRGPQPTGSPDPAGGGHGPARPVWPGTPRPLGAHHRLGPDAMAGVNFALWAAGAQAVELCLFDGKGDTEETRLPLTERTDGIWHGFVPGIRPGQAYGYRVHGDWDPQRGARWNPAKLLLDPYARAVDGDFAPPPGPPQDTADGLPVQVYGHVRDWPEQAVADTVRDDRDSARHVPKGIVVGDLDGLRDHEDGPAVRFDPQRPAIPWSETVIYELHVRGFTMRHPDVPPELRGTYAGLGHPAAIAHLVRLGVTTVELLPVHQFAHEDHLLRKGLRNYWGYNSIGYFAPHAGFAASGTRGQQVEEFRRMVRALHAANLEVILDVVYNHTAEGNELGPTLSLRGIDNPGYYRLQDDRRRYADYSGCGNTLHVVQPQVLRLITDSLRYWVTRMGVDGFRFDLAAALTRGAHGVDMLSPFLSAIAQDPVLRHVKLIAEPWDTGPGGYQVGAFPAPWAEWNDRYRDAVRDFWRGAGAGTADLGYRLSGSSDLYAPSGRSPRAAINFVTAHDGFTLRDLVSYQDKHNEDNGEDNRDGSNDNRSWNCGAEGETDSEPVRRLRLRQQRNLLATLLLSTGVPMLVAGDEMGRTQRGNNNAYCQDNDIGWIDWSLLRQPDWGELCDLVARLIAVRRAHPVLRRDGFFSGQPRTPNGPRDLTWFTPDGMEMTDADWLSSTLVLGMHLSGGALAQRDAQGRPVTDNSFLVILHAGAEPVRFALPGTPWAEGYEFVLDTCAMDGDPADGDTRHTPHATPHTMDDGTGDDHYGGPDGTADTAASSLAQAPLGAARTPTFRAGSTITVPERCVVVLRALDGAGWQRVRRKSR